MTVGDYPERELIEHDEVSLPLFRRMAALLDLDPAALSEGDELPLSWSSLLFPTLARQSEIDQDGHPRRGGFLPDVKLPRRRFAGREVRLFHPLRIGDRVRRRSTIADVAEKSGRNGPLVFVTVLHEAFTGDRLAYTERQSIVYLNASQPSVAEPPRPQAELPRPEWTDVIAFDPVMLFRYSALSYNSHRIHYDRDYAMSVENYQGLVVNGGLTTLFLIELARRHLAARIISYTMRASNILFAGQTVRLHGAKTASGATLWATEGSGGLVMRVDITAV